MKTIGKVRLNRIINAENICLYEIFALLFPIYSIVCDRFKYLGYFRYTGIDVSRLVLGIALVLLLVCISNHINDEFLRITYCISMVMFYFGEICLFVCDENVDLTMITIFTFYFFFLKAIDKTTVRIARIKTSIDIHNVLLFITVAFFIPYLKYSPYINLKNLLFIDIYETRSEFNQLGMPRILSYLYGPLARVIIPFLLVEYYKRKRKGIVVILSVMLLYLFLCGALKSIFMGLLSIFFFYSGTYEKKRKRFVYLILLFELASLLLVFFMDNLFLINIIRRVYFIAARFNNYYVDYFRGNYTYYSHSRLAFWMNRDWLNGLDISHYAGQYVMGTGTNANTGLFVEGYYSFGLIGAVLYLVVPTSIIWYLKSLDYKSEFYGIVFLYLYYFNTSILSTMLLTHGLFLFLIIATIYLRTSPKKDK